MKKIKSITKKAVAYLFIFALMLTGISYSGVSTYAEVIGAAAEAEVHDAAAGQSYTKVRITEDPQVVDTYKGVKAKYRPGTGNTNTGTYCCAQYVKNFYKANYSVTISNLVTGATPNAGNGYTAKKIKSPRVGDIYYQTNSKGNGHWAIVKKSTELANGTYKVVLIEQNWKWNDGSKTYAAKNRTIQPNKYGHNVKFFRVYKDSTGKPLT